MLPDPVNLDDTALAAHLTQLDDQQLADVITAVDTAEILTNSRPVVMAAAADWYARVLDWPVFPCKPGAKQPLTTNGFKDATTDRQQIAAWWQRWPDANIGVPTGAAGCGYDVVDVDGRDGLNAWAVLRHSNCPTGCCDLEHCPNPGPFNIHAHSFTPGNSDKGPGRHLFIPATGDGNTTRLAGVSIDYRGAGGYVIVPPSNSSNGVRYTWIQRPSRPSADERAAA